MRRFKVCVNGTEYTVDIEEITGSEPAAQSVPAAPAASAQPEKAVEARPAGTEVKSPIQGTVVKTSVSVGDTVAAGDRICVLEAMKMEYDINAPCAGKISAVGVTRGETAEEGRVLAVIS